MNIRRAAMKDAFQFVQVLTVRKLLNYVRIKISFYISVVFRRPLHRGLPVGISVEPTTSCNLRCPGCPSGLKMLNRPQGALAMQDFRNLIDQVKGHLMYLMLYFQGEPLLNPGIFDMVSYAKKKRIYTATSTNGHHLNDNNARRIVESGLDRLIISMDGTDQETYEKYRVGGGLEEVKEGIRNVIKWKKILKTSKPFVIIQFLVFKFNEHQLEEIKSMSKALGTDKLELKTAQVIDYKYDRNFIPANARFSRYTRDAEGNFKLKKSLRNRCFRMWSGTVVTWDGRIVPCCFDKDAAHQMGHLGASSLREIWKSKGYNDFRDQILNDRRKVDICINCTE